jgi:ABC-type methionine transport system permease subunit
VPFYAAVTEFAVGVVERGMTESAASLGDMYYNM